MTTGEIITLGAYAIGVLATIYFQGKKISTLKTQVTSQNDIMANMQRFMSIFRLDEIEKYVEINRKRVEAETEETTKRVEKEIREKALESVHVLRREQEALLDLTMKFLNTPTMLRDTKRYLEEMNDDVFSKKPLLEVYEKNYQAWGNVPENVLRAMVMHDEAMRRLLGARGEGREGQE